MSDNYVIPKVATQADSPVRLSVPMNAGVHYLSIEKLTATTGTITVKRKAQGSAGTARVVKDEFGADTVVNVATGAELEISGRAEYFLLDFSGVDGTVNVSMSGM